MFLNALPLAVELLTLLLTLAGLVYLLLALLATRSFRRQMRPTAPKVLPTLSILKPVKGFDPGLLDALRSHCRQTYAGRFELLLGASGDTEEQEELRTMLAQLRREFPTTNVRLVACGERLGTNGKVSTLLQMLPHALGEVLLINDADIRVSMDYLSRVTAWLAQPEVGLVTVPYFAQVPPRGGVWSRLEALGISTEFFPSVLVARMMERGVRFGMGSTLALRRTTLHRIGGLEPLLDLLADDYELGARTAAAGMRVVLANEPVATSVPQYSLRGFATHQTRWYRTVRDARRLGYLGMVTTYALPWAMATVVSSGVALWSVSLLSLTLLLRVAVALFAGVGVLQDGQVLRDLALLPVRDVASLLFWVWSFAGNTVLWRGERFRVQDGRLLRLDPAVAVPEAAAPERVEWVDAEDADRLEAEAWEDAPAPAASDDMPVLLPEPEASLPENSSENVVDAEGSAVVPLPLPQEMKTPGTQTENPATEELPVSQPVAPLELVPVPEKDSAMPVEEERVTAEVGDEDHPAHNPPVVGSVPALLRQAPTEQAERPTVAGRSQPHGKLAIILPVVVNLALCGFIVYRWRKGARQRSTPR